MEKKDSMGCCTRFACIISCGIYPKLIRIGYNDWKLKNQIFTGVTASLILVQVIFIIVLVVNLNLFFNSTYDQLMDFVTVQRETNIIQRSFDSSDQLASAFEFSEWAIQKNAAMINEIVQPEYFQVYPIDWTKTQIYPFSEISTTTNSSLSYNFTTYSTQGTLTPELKKLAQKFTTFNNIWRRLIYLYLGPFDNLNFARLYAIFPDPKNACNALILTFPGQQFTWNTGCANLDNQFGSMWTQTIKLKTGQYYVTQYESIDPFNGIFQDGVVGISTPIVNQTTNSTVGIFGGHFTKDFFQTLMGPIINEISGSLNSEDVLILSYWVYAQQNLKYDQPIYQSNATLVLDEPTFLMMLEQAPTTNQTFEVTIAGQVFNATKINSPSDASITGGYSYAQNTQYVIFFTRNQQSGAQFEVTLNSEIIHAELVCHVIIITLSVVFSILISYIIFRYTNQITQPIDRLCVLTEKLTLATNANQKKKVVEEDVKTDVMFAEIRKEFEEKTPSARASKKVSDQEPLLPKEINEKNEKTRGVSARNEIEELKKIFYQFFIRETEANDSKTLYEPKYYEKQPKEPIYTLDDGLSSLLDQTDDIDSELEKSQRGSVTQYLDSVDNAADDFDLLPDISKNFTVNNDYNFLKKI